MAEKKFNAANPLAAQLGSLEPGEAINIAKLLCLAAVSRAGANGCHGGINPRNIDYTNKKAILGPESKGNRDSLTGDELEYIAPERFWSGALTPSCDVYSIGIILYTALNGGRMPLVAEEGKEERTPAARAATLRSRMKGQDFPAPRYAGRELSSLIMKACAFKPEDRYSTPTDLLLALEALPEGSSIPAAVPLIPMTDEQVKATKMYKVDKNFEELDSGEKVKTFTPSRSSKVIVNEVAEASKEKKGANKSEDKTLTKDTPAQKKEAEKFRKSQPRKNAAGIIIPIIIAIIVIAAIVSLLKGCNGSGEISPEASFIVNAVENTDDNIIIAPGESGKPAAAPKPTEAVAETPEPTDEPKETTYEVYVEDVTWQQAKLKCESKGGKLATIRNYEDLKQISELVEVYGVKYVWLGAYRSTGDEWLYVDNTPVTYENWDKGEPSYQDLDGTPEDYMIMWKSPSTGTWKFNDMRNDPISLLPGSFSGNICYICQYN